jgi:hypothetical protein
VVIFFLNVNKVSNKCTCSCQECHSQAAGHIINQSWHLKVLISIQLRFAVLGLMQIGSKCGSPMLYQEWYSQVASHQVHLYCHLKASDCHYSGCQ